jgi:hypothetical protein
MNLPLQNWLNTQKISKEALSSLDESFICFKVGAYKASLLFAYLGFMNIIRDRIIASPAPAGLTVNHWAGIQANAKSPETWEKIVFDAIQQKHPASIFDVPDDLRDQVKYWKDRRNDCAHSKQNKIIAAHVESLYAFIESNLGKFAVNGSRPEMIKRILDYFNPSLTSPNEALTPIIHDLINALPSAEYPSFITEAISEIEKAQSNVPTLLGMGNPNVIKFLGACFRDGTDDLRNACRTSLGANDDLLISFLREYPDKVYILQNQPQKVRLIWHDGIFDRFHNDFSLLCSLLRASLIPQDQIEEAVSLAVKASASHLPPDVDLQTLIQNGYYVLLEKTIVEQRLMSSFDWANSNKELIVKYLSENTISRGVAEAIYSAFNGEHFAWHLAEYLNRFFSQNPNKKAEYLAHTGGDPNIGVPSALPSLSNP